MPSPTLAFLVPHPDDFAVAFGGTAWLLKDRYALHVVCLTQGERGLSPEPRAETAALREKEEQAACALVGAHLTWLGQMDGEVFASRDVCERAAQRLKDVQPVAVFSMWPIDKHPDHSACSEIARKALKLAGLTSEFYMGEADLGRQTVQFTPDIRVDISGVIAQKMAQVRCHVCQNTDDALCRSAVEKARFRGLECGVAYAEGFKTIHPLRSAERSIFFG